ncbi:helix-turn-helix domain-containing protein [Pseudonocardia sp.]|uniref:helix-turn-helix domain-containing protein n=1 Tax=Pseudonocardia sp. TaxID=60912 RepID=UPI0031FDB28E
MTAAEYWTSGPAEGPDGWASLLSATHLPWQARLPPDPDRPFTAWARRWWIDDLALVDCACGPCSGVRRRREIAATDGEFVVVLMTLAGRESVEQGGVRLELRPGDAVLWDSTVAASFAVHEPLGKRSLLVPRAALEEVGGRAWLGTGTVLDGGAPAVRLLRGYLDTLREALPTLGPSAVAAARNATLELLVGAARADSGVVEGRPAAPALRASMERWIDRHLLGHDVTPAAVARAHGVSVRTVNRTFSATGHTVGEVVRVRRLARAREELVDRAAPITSIAHRWGFADGSHFSRAFRAVYGCSPSDYRAGAPGSGAHRPEGGAAVQAAEATTG